MTASDTSFRTGLKEALISAVNGIQIDCLPNLTEEGVEGAPRVIEFFCPDAGLGGLISFELRDGLLHVQLYRCDPDVRVMVGNVEHRKAWARVDETGMIGMEARCGKCGEEYHPRSERMLNGDAIHLTTTRGEACGGIGEVLGWWGRGPNGAGHEEEFLWGKRSVRRDCYHGISQWDQAVAQGHILLTVRRRFPFRPSRSCQGRC
jgi:hypothetical protein